MPNPASILIFVLACIAAAAVYFLVFAAFEHIEGEIALTPHQRAECRFETGLLAGVVAIVIGLLVAGLASPGGVA